MGKKVFHAKYVDGTGQAKKILRKEHPELGLDFYEGTVNFCLNEKFTPPLDNLIKEAAKKRKTDFYIDGNHISPTARVFSINGKMITGFLYRGGNRDNPLEVVFRKNISQQLKEESFELTTLYVEEHETTEIVKALREDNPKGDALWMKLQQIADEIFGI